MNTLDVLRRIRDSSRFVRFVHRYLREPYYRAMLFAYPEGLLQTLPGNLEVKLHPRLRGMNIDIYEPDISEVFDRFVNPGMCVVDIGAHLGLHTIRLSRNVGPEGNVIAVEASPANYSQLNSHLIWNSVKNVVALHAAVSDQVGEIEFKYASDALDPSGFANSIAYDIQGSTSQIKTMTIDDICCGVVPDLIKIDIEGAEMLAIRGALKTLLECSPILVIAVHPEAMMALKTSPEDIVEALTELGYGAFDLSGRPLSRKIEFEEVLFMKPDVSGLVWSRPQDTINCFDTLISQFKLNGTK